MLFIGRILSAYIVRRSSIGCVGVGRFCVFWEKCVILQLIYWRFELSNGCGRCPGDGKSLRDFGKPQMHGIVFTDMVTGLERVADHATNIAFSILDEDPEDDSDI